MKQFAQKSFLAMVYVLLYAPIFILILYSVNNTKYSLQWKGISFRWYQELFQDTSLWSALSNSIFLGLCAAFIATVIALLTSVYLFLHQNRQQKFVSATLLLLVIIPDIVLGVALLIFFNISHIPLGFWSLLIAHITFCLPFAMIPISARIDSIDPNVYYSALDLGASRFIALVRVLLPLLKPGVLSGFLLCFTLSFDDVIISYFVAGPDFTILPLTIYALVRAGVTPELNALCSLTLILSMIPVVLSYKLGKSS